MVSTRNEYVNLLNYVIKLVIRISGVNFFTYSGLIQRVLIFAKYFNNPLSNDRESG